MNHFYLRLLQHIRTIDVCMTRTLNCILPCMPQRIRFLWMNHVYGLALGIIDWGNPHVGQRNFTDASGVDLGHVMFSRMVA